MDELRLFVKLVSLSGRLRQVPLKTRLKLALGIDSLGIQSLEALVTQLGVTISIWPLVAVKAAIWEKPSALAEGVFTIIPSANSGFPWEEHVLLMLKLVETPGKKSLLSFQKTLKIDQDKQ